MEVVHLVLAILGFTLVWTTSVVTGVIWLSSKFRSVEKLIYREMTIHRNEDLQQFKQVSERLQKVELKTFGFTGEFRGPPT